MQFVKIEYGYYRTDVRLTNLEYNALAKKVQRRKYFEHV